MGNFEKLSVLVIVVIIVMILVVALYTWTDNPDSPASGGTDVTQVENPGGPGATALPPLPATPAPVITPSSTPEAKPGMKDGSGALVVPPPGRTIKDLLEQEGGMPPVPAVPPPAPETPKPTEPRVHVVEPGQTMGGIAKLYYPGRVQKGLQAMQTANPGVDSARMSIGTKLTIPDLGAPAGEAATPVSAQAAAPKPAATIERGGWYVTKRGDTLTSISKRAYGTTERWPEIWIENMDALGHDFERPDPGIRIRIPR